MRKIEIEIEARDILEVNSKTWQVDEFDPFGAIDLVDIDNTGNIRGFYPEELEQYISHAGHFRHVKEEYIDHD